VERRAVGVLFLREPRWRPGSVRGRMPAHGRRTARRNLDAKIRRSGRRATKSSPVGAGPRRSKRRRYWACLAVRFRVTFAGASLKPKRGRGRKQAVFRLHRLPQRHARSAKRRSPCGGGFAQASAETEEAATLYANSGEGLRHIVDRLEARTAEATDSGCAWRSPRRPSPPSERSWPRNAADGRRPSGGARDLRREEDPTSTPAGAQEVSRRPEG
jgi:hypothetical protein